MFRQKYLFIAFINGAKAIDAIEIGLGFFSRIESSFFGRLDRDFFRTGAVKIIKARVQFNYYVHHETTPIGRYIYNKYTDIISKKLKDVKGRCFNVLP